MQSYCWIPQSLVKCYSKLLLNDLYISELKYNSFLIQSHYWMFLSLFSHPMLLLDVRSYFPKLVSMSSIAPQDDSDIFSGSGFLFAFKATVESLWFPYYPKLLLDCPRCFSEFGFHSFEATLGRLCHISEFVGLLLHSKPLLSVVGFFPSEATIGCLRCFPRVWN